MSREGRDEDLGVNKSANSARRSSRGGGVVSETWPVRPLGHSAWTGLATRVCVGSTTQQTAGCRVGRVQAAAPLATPDPVTFNWFAPKAPYRVLCRTADADLDIWIQAATQRGQAPAETLIPGRPLKFGNEETRLTWSRCCCFCCFGSSWRWMALACRV